KRLLVGHRGAVTALAFSPDNKTLASGTTDDKNDQSVKLWDTASGKLLSSWEPIGMIPALGYSADGKRLLAWVPSIDPAGQNPVSNVRVCEAGSGKLLDTIADRDRLVHCLAFSADGDLVAMGGDDGSVRVWKTAKAERLFNGDLPAHAKRVTDLIITPDK